MSVMTLKFLVVVAMVLVNCSSANRPESSLDVYSNAKRIDEIRQFKNAVEPESSGSLASSSYRRDDDANGKADDKTDDTEDKSEDKKKEEEEKEADNSEKNKKEADSNDEQPEETKSTPTTESVKDGKNRKFLILQQTWFRVLLAIVGLMLIPMFCICIHHVFHISTRGGSPYGKLEVHLSPF